MRRPILAMFPLVLVLLIAGCTSGESADEPEDETTTTQAPSSTTQPRPTIEMSLVFDGKTCTFDGPTELTPGPVHLTLFNESDDSAATNFLELLEGKTIEDIRKWNGPYNPTNVHHPPWSRELGTWEPVPVGRSQHWTKDVTPGIYYIVCAQMRPLLVWEGAGLTVTE